MHPFEIDLAPVESLRHKPLRILPRRWIPPYRPGVHDHLRLLRDLVPCHHAVRFALPRKQQRRWRV
ncbi:hypothetical protein LINPERPRIM_LOCUS23518 [Linum perenne]